MADDQTDIYKERFENLLRVLRVVQEHEQELSSQLTPIFDLTWWYDNDDKCGTTACAIGWCCQDPWFQRQGFALGSDQGMPKLFFPKYHGLEEWEAVQKFFDLDGDEADFLFRAEAYGDERVLAAVINRVEAFMNERFSEEDKQQCLL